MRRKILTAAIAAVIGMGAASANAHPGSKILTAGGADERTAMTPGMSFEETNGVHLFRGKVASGDGATAPAKDVPKIKVEIKIAAPSCSWRRLRGLRTQGFYSGDPYPSRRYTQGFYSGR